LPVFTLIVLSLTSRVMSSEDDPERVTEQLLKELAASFVRYLDVDYLSKSRPGQVVLDIMGPLFEQSGIKLEKVQFFRTVFHGYEEPYPLKEVLAIESFSEIRPVTRLGLEMEITTTLASRLKVVCLGRLVVKRDEVKATGLTVIEVKEAEPKKDVVPRANDAEKVIRDLVLTLIAYFLFELLKKTWEVMSAVSG